MLYGRAEGRGFHLPLSDGTLAAGAGIWCCVLVLARILDPAHASAARAARSTTTCAGDSWWRSRPRCCSPWRACAAGAVTTTARARRSPRTSTPRPRTPGASRAAMRALVTGATGKVGHAVAHALAARGDEVRALVRDPDQGRGRAARRGRAGARRRHRPALRGRGGRGLRGRLQRDGPAGAVAARRDAVRPRERGGHADGRARPRGRPASGGSCTRAPRTSSTRSPAGRFDESRVADYPKGTAYERSKQRAEQLALESRATASRS